MVGSAAVVFVTPPPPPLVALLPALPLPLGLPRGRPVGTGFGLRWEGESGGRPRLRFVGWSGLGVCCGVDAIFFFFALSPLVGLIGYVEEFMGVGWL